MDQFNNFVVHAIDIDDNMDTNNISINNNVDSIKANL